MDYEKYYKNSIESQRNNIRNTIRYFRNDERLDIENILNDDKRIDRIVADVDDSQFNDDCYEQLFKMWTLWALERESGLKEEDSTMFSFEPIRIFYKD